MQRGRTVPPRSWRTDRRYLLLACATFVLVAIQTANHQWSSDMWEHVAVVRELIARPWDPDHPQIASDATHPGFSPYGVLLGLLGKLTGASAVGILMAAALVNVVLLLAAFRRLVAAVTASDRAPFWALLFTLTLWGPGPFRYSGFFNLNSIGFVAPFPSTFATAVAFATLVSGLHVARGGGRRHVVAVAAGAAAVLLIHPLSFVWLAAALLVLPIAQGVNARRCVARLGVAAAGAALLSLAWPYFSVVSLVRDSGDLEALNRTMYDGVLPRVAPLLLALPLLVRRWRAARRDVVVLWSVVVAVLYGLGAITDNTSLGRTLAFGVVLLAVALADQVARWEPVPWRRRSTGGRATVAVGAALILLGLFASRGGLVRMVPAPLLPGSVREADELARLDERYGAVLRSVDDGDVVVGSTRADDRLISAVAGRTLALPDPRPFVPDGADRKAAARAILHPATTNERRDGLAARYDVTHVLLHDDDPGDTLLRERLAAEGARVVEEHDGLVLIALSGGGP